MRSSLLSWCDRAIAEISTGLRTQIEQAREATRAAEVQIANFDARLAAATTAVRAEKEAAEAELSTLKTEHEKVKQESENRYRIGINWKRRTDTLTEERKGLQAEMDSKDKEIAEIKEKIASLNTELESTKAKLAETEKKSGDAQRANELKDGTVQRLQTELAAKAAPPPPAGQDVAALVRSERLQTNYAYSRTPSNSKGINFSKNSARSRRIWRRQRPQRARRLQRHLPRLVQRMAKNRNFKPRSNLCKKTSKPRISATT